MLQQEVADICITWATSHRMGSVCQAPLALALARIFEIWTSGAVRMRGSWATYAPEHASARICGYTQYFGLFTSIPLEAFVRRRWHLLWRGFLDIPRSLSTPTCLFEGVCVTTVILAPGASNPRSDLTVVAHFRGIRWIMPRITGGSDLMVYAIKTQFWSCQLLPKC